MSLPDAQPRRKRRHLSFLLPVILLALVGVSMAIPGSPIYLAKLLEPDVKIDNRSRSEWAADLSSPDATTRVKAANAIGQMNTGGKRSIPDLARLMQADPDADVRAAASEALSKMYPTTESDAAKDEYAKALLEPFTAALTDPEGRVRNNATLGLLKMKARAKPAVPALLKAADAPENDTNLNIFHATIRQVMLRAIGEAAAGTAEGVPTFAAILEEKLEWPAGVRQGRGAPGAVLTKEQQEAIKLHDKKVVHRRIAVTGLGLAGEHGRGSESKIRELLKSSDPEDKTVAKEALERMGLPVEEK